MDELRPDSASITKMLTYHVVFAIAVARCIGSDWVPEEEWSVTSSSPEKPFTGGLRILNCADMLLHNVKSVGSDVGPLLIYAIIGLAKFI